MSLLQQLQGMGPIRSSLAAWYSSKAAAAAPGQAPSGLRPLRILMLACVILSLLLFAAFGMYRHGQVQAEAEVRLQRSLSIAHEHALRVLDTNETLLRHVLDLSRENDDAVLPAHGEALHLTLADLGRNKPQVQSIRVQGPDGQTLATNRAALPPAGLDAMERSDLRWHKDKRGELYISEPAVDKATGEKFFETSRARYRGNGDFAGLVSVSLLPSYFTHFHSQLAAEEPGLAITMFRQDGVVYSRWPALANAPDRMSRSSEVLSRVLRGATSGTIRSVSSLDGQERLIVFRKLADYPLYIGTGRELSAITSELAKELAIIGVFAVIPMLGIVAAGYLAIRRTREALESAKRLQEEAVARRHIEEALLQAQKMEALGRLTGGVAHDFNNALMVISGNLHLLRLTQPGAPPKYGDAIARAVESATRLTRQLLAFSRRQALAPETIRLQDRLPALRDLLAPALGSAVALDISVRDDTWPIHIDVAELELAILNLAVNARDAMPNGGSLRLLARNCEWDRERGAAVRTVWVEVIDTGEGMPATIAAKAFDPFFTTKPVGKGTGLGLSQVYALCKRAGGDVSLQSVPGKGTMVRMRFPVAAGSSGPHVVAEPRQLSFDKTVLVVEDNPEVAAVVVPVLQNLGCEVVHLDSADAAIEWLKGEHPNIDLLLTDVVMPGEFDGAALAREVKAKYPGVKVVLMTGYAEELNSISRLGFHVLPKPFSPQTLAEALERVGLPGAPKA